jgi:hypothetical protein
MVHLFSLEFAIFSQNKPITIAPIPCSTLQNHSKKIFIILLLVFIVKINAAQTLNRAQSFLSTGNNVPHAILTDALGNSYVGGSFTDSCDFDPGPNEFILFGNSDGFVCKFNPSGQLLWTMQIGNSGADVCKAMALHPAGFLVVSGTFSGTVDFDPSNNGFLLTSQGSNDAFVALYDDSGNFINAIAFGGNEIVQINELLLTSNQHILLCGSFTGNVDFDPGPNIVLKSALGAGDGFVLCLNPSGNFTWVNLFGGNDLFAMDEVTGIAELPNGNIVSCGYFSSTMDLDPGTGNVPVNANGMFDLFIAKTNAAGQYMDGLTLGGSDVDLAYAIATAPQGNIIVSGSFTSTMDADPQAPITLVTSNGMSDALWLCLDEQFNFQWFNQIGGTGNDVAGKVWCDGLANVYTGGHFSQQADMDPGQGLNIKNSQGQFDFFATVFDPLGNCLGSYTMGGSQNDVFYDLSAGPNNSFFYCGTFIDSLDADAGAGQTWLQTPNQSINSFVLKLDRCLMPDLALLSSSANVVCAGSAVQIEVLSGDLNDATDWTWYEDNCGGNAFATGLSQFIYPTQSMNIYIRGEGGCVSTGNCNSVFLEVLPSPLISLGNDTTFCYGDFLFLQADSSYTSYLWSTGDTTHSIHLQAINFPLGINAISLAVTDTSGCMGMDEILLDVTICNGSKKLKPGVDSFVFPNPAQQMIQINHSTGGKNQTWNIYGVEGNLIQSFYKTNQNNNYSQFDISMLSNGMYFIKNENGDMLRFSVLR